MLNLKTLFKNYHDTARAFSELVPWMALIEPDMVLNQDGSLLICFTFDGVDAEGIEQIEADRYANLLEHALKVCDEHMTLWSTVDRRRIVDYPSSHFESSIATRVDAAWKTQFDSGNQYANKHYISFMYAPSKGADGFFEGVTAHLKTKQAGIASAIIDTARGMLSKERALESHLQQLSAMKQVFYNKIRDFEETVAELGFKRLAGESLLTFLHSRCSPASAGHPVAVPDVPAYLNTWLPDNTLSRDHDFLTFHDTKPCYVMGATVKWPGAARPGAMDALLKVSGEITTSQCFRFVNHDKAKKYIEDIERHLRAQSKSMMTMALEQTTGEQSDQVDTGKLVLAEDAQMAMQELTVSGRAFGYYNMTVLTYGATVAEAEDTLKQVSTQLRQRGFVLMRETLHLLSAFCGTMPAQWAKLVRWAFMNVANVADLALIRTLDVGDKDCAHLTSQTGRPLGALTVMQTEYSTPYYFDPYKEHLAHTLVVGPSRTGKSAYMNFFISQFGKYAPCNRVIFDKDKSCKIPTLLQGGAHVNMDLRAGGDTPRLNPMKLVGDRNNWIWLSNWLKGLAVGRGYQLKAEDDRAIREAIEQTAAQPETKWRLSTFVVLLNDKNLAEQYQEWVDEGSFASIFDNVDDEFALTDFVCIEMGGLFDTVVAGPFMDYAFFRINQKLDGKPTLIYIEECWYMLKDPTFAAKIDDWLRTLAKKNAFVVMATQSLHEIATSPIFASIIDNIKNRIYLPNADAYAHRQMYNEMFGLNDAQIDRIAAAIPKQHYYFVTSSVSRMAVVRFPKEILAVVRSDSKAQKIFDRWHSQRETRPDWDEQYLKEVSYG